MMSRCLSYSLLLCLLALVGCSSLPLQPGSDRLDKTLAPDSGLPTSIPATLTAEQLVTPRVPGETGVITGTTGTGILRIWLPLEFDPAGNSPASQLLYARLEEFAAQHPGTGLDVRVKALEGTGGMLDALVSANAAAPLALPDLVLLPRPLLESAALKGLLHPFDGFSSLMDDPGWFDYAQQLSQLKASTYGMPFAGDAMAMAYHPSKVENPPNNLETAISLGEALLFPAADPQALFTLGQYLAKGESLQDADGRPSMDPGTVVSILEDYQRASQAGVMPYWITQYVSAEQVWEAFTDGQFPMAVTWLSAYMKNKNTSPDDLSMEAMPTQDGYPFTLATGYSWALAGAEPERRALAVQLAEFLVENEFLASWTSAAGYLPPRVDALRGWQDTPFRQLIEQISYSAQLMPSADLIASLGPAMEQAVVDVLKAQSSPENAAQTAIDRINKP